MQTAEVDALRLSPLTGDFTALYPGYADRISGGLSAEALIAQLAVWGRSLSDKSLLGPTGMEWLGQSDGPSAILARSPERTPP